MKSSFFSVSRLTIALLVTSVFIQGPMWVMPVAHANIGSIGIIPPEPTMADLVEINVGGWLPNTCWHFDYFQCPSMIGNVIYIDCYMTVTGMICLPVVLPYNFSCNLGSLLPGEYIVIVTEYRPPPLPPDILMLDFTVTEFTVALDIKPRSCPNPLNVKVFEKPAKNAKSKKGGVLPVAILGSADFDVLDIDVSMLLLEGVTPLHSSYEDVAAPVQNGDECACTNAGPDGTMDLTLKFLKRDIATAIGIVSDGDVIPFTLTGQLLDGTPFKAVDCVWILSKKENLPSFADADEVILKPAVPNPFNPDTRISYYLPREEFVKLSIFNVTGMLVQELVAQQQVAGKHVVEWSADGMPSGVYFYRLKIGGKTLTKKMVLIR